MEEDGAAAKHTFSQGCSLDFESVFMENVSIKRLFDTILCSKLIFLAVKVKPEKDGSLKNILIVNIRLQGIGSSFDVEAAVI